MTPPIREDACHELIGARFISVETRPSDLSACSTIWLWKNRGAEKTFLLYRWMTCASLRIGFIWVNDGGRVIFQVRQEKRRLKETLLHGILCHYLHELKPEYSNGRQTYRKNNGIQELGLCFILDRSGVNGALDSIYAGECRQNSRGFLQRALGSRASFG
jgi:hypothetical protein